ncbi:aminomethyl-transferring glycine dehydrogenase [Alistipes sp.]|uniref:aminomethyl-transferring glycine dehydrogenase n=2 Tax=Alistipes TaxID=239759 RepID=UPI000E886628|nr:aminomethyl-transferring glycine dehydrogenase [Alistipes sp.]HBX91238.1 glycine dehydrogenase (aminomethyl-transferring) [Alistipes sp.]
MFDTFSSRHIGVTDEKDLKQMLSTIGVESVDALIAQVIPQSIRLKKPLALPAEGMSEYEFAAHIRELADRNRPLRSFIGMGYYPCAVPAAVVRNVFENPAWYTSYTPYQAEISQGRLEALLNFQTAVISLTGMQIGNCSLLDEATAAAEAMLMMFALRSREAVKEGRCQLFVDRNIFPQTLDVLLTRSEPFGIELIVDDYDDYEFTGREFGAVVQYPAADGSVRDYAAFAAAAHERGVLVTAVADLLALALLKAPGEWGADIAVGSAQRLGTPMGFGGPSAGYMATREAYKRNMPGRIIGVSVDRLGRRALRMALQMREQHIKRERATSNICTASALMASMAGFYCVYNGPEGLRRAAETAHGAAARVAAALEAMDYALASRSFFDTLEVEAEAAVVQSLALESGFNFHYPSEGRVRLSFDEVTTDQEVEAVVRIFAAAKGRKVKAAKAVEAIPAELRRTSAYLAEPVFNSYRSESALMRYVKQLELRDISLANSMISLGSCTMKLNAAAIMQPLSLAGFQNVHPFAPEDQTEGYRALIAELERDLATITGLAACSLQPNSGAAGEYAGLMVIRAYHQSRGQGYRNVVLIPASAHGTNPASAAMAGMKIVTVACDERGNIDVDDLRRKADEHASELCGLMVTYPSTHGVFESRIREIVDAVHDAGGQVYMDGANMNAQVGLTNPGYIGADVCHLNLHKTFAMPHGGGGPGVGPICVAEHLRPFLPSHPVVATGGDEGITAVASAPWGSAMLLPITYGYIKMLGGDGLRRATEMAIVNANYMSAALASEYRTYYSGETGRVGHEMILDLTHFKRDYDIDCGDIAHRLMDYGFHAPTLSFPVHETLMVEPTESEPKAEMDRFIAALVQIKRECEAAAAAGEKDNPVRNAPHTAEELAGEWAHPYTRMEAAFPLEWVRTAKFFPYVSKIDNGYGDRNLCCVNCE